MHDKALRLPEYLKEVLVPTASGIAKLIAVWDGLQVETQLLLLHELRRTKVPAYLYERFRKVALQATNPFVRYLIARDCYFNDEASDEENIAKKRIESDSCPLVKYSQEEQKSMRFLGFEPNPVERFSKFFSLPHNARLARIRGLMGRGEQFSNLIKYYLENQEVQQEVDELEFYECLLEYLNTDTFSRVYRSGEPGRDGSVEYGKGCQLDSLWELVSLLPEWMSFVLIEKLPLQYGLSTGPTDEQIGSFTDAQVQTLLQREDVDLPELRKRLFFESEKLRSYAISKNFDLTFNDFDKVLSQPKEVRKYLLEDLALYADNLNVVFYAALFDLGRAFDIPCYSNLDFVEQHFNKKLQELDEGQQARQILDLRLYRLAKSIVPWEKDEYSEELDEHIEFLNNSIHSDNRWKTFMSFSKVWRANGYYLTKRLEKYLPRIEEVSEEDELDEECSSYAEEATSTVGREIADVPGNFTLAKELRDLRTMVLVGIGLLMVLIIAT